MLRLLDLFSGIGGFSLGLERSGAFETVAFCEINAFCRDHLAERWPGVPCYDDIRTLTAARLAADGIVPDAICGGFPCQDVSDAGARAGMDGARSGLWSEYARLIGEVRPRIVIVENVTGLLDRGIGRVLGDLAALRYDAEWEVVSLADVGAPHQRERVWLVAYPEGERRPGILRDWAWRCASPREEWPAAPLDSLDRAAAWLASAAARVSPVLGDDDGFPRGLAIAALAAFGNSVGPQIPELIGRAIAASNLPNNEGLT